MRNLQPLLGHAFNQNRQTNGLAVHEGAITIENNSFDFR